MKRLIIPCLLLLSLAAPAQNTTTRPVEPQMETSYDNMELLIMALVGLVLLIAMYFFFRKTRKRNNNG
jgi:heme/copper-type cytochrome/quinol oxidase subunit 2